MKRAKYLQQRARSLRNNMTKAEKKIWYDCFSKRQFHGLRFLRQKVIGNYIVDFYCHELKLIVEIDGKSHQFDDAKALDLERDWILSKAGYTVFRITNYEVIHSAEEAFTVLESKVHELRASL